jgi:hypothetical protein
MHAKRTVQVVAVGDESEEEEGEDEVTLTASFTPL